MYKQRSKILLIVVFFVISTISLLAAPTSFLPMEDELSTSRVSVYGVSVDNLKPYRPSTPIQVEYTKASTFGSKNMLFGVLLLGVYIVFLQRRDKARSVSF